MDPQISDIELQCIACHYWPKSKIYLSDLLWKEIQYATTWSRNMFWEHTERSIEHRKDPRATSRPERMGQRIRYSHINKTAGVMTTWRKSEHGNIRDHSRKRNNVFRDGQLLMSIQRKVNNRRLASNTFNKTFPNFHPAIRLICNFPLQLTWVLNDLTELCSSS